MILLPLFQAITEHCNQDEHLRDSFLVKHLLNKVITGLLIVWDQLRTAELA